MERAATYLAAIEDPEVGGDFYDIYQTPDGWGLAIGDVSGKGDEAAAVTATQGRWSPTGRLFEGVLVNDPDAALRAWMDRFAGYVAAKRDMADTLRVIVAAGTITTSQARERLAASVQVLLDAGVAAGTLRDDVLAQDVMVSLVGIFLACGRPEHSEQSEQAGRMMDLLMAGLRRQLAADPAVPGPAAS